MKVSERWTSEERLAAINQIAEDMLDVAFGKQPMFPWRNTIQFWANSLRFLSSWPSGFLEANRNAILETRERREARLGGDSSGL